MVLITSFIDNIQKNFLHGIIWFLGKIWLGHVLKGFATFTQVLNFLMGRLDRSFWFQIESLLSHFKWCIWYQVNTGRRNIIRVTFPAKTCFREQPQIMVPLLSMANGQTSCCFTERGKKHCTVTQPSVTHVKWYKLFINRCCVIIRS